MIGAIIWFSVIAMVACGGTFFIAKFLQREED